MKNPSIICGIDPGFRECNYCKETFKAKGTTVKYCSQKCYYAYRKQIAKEKPKGILIKISEGIYKKYLDKEVKGHNFRALTYVEVKCSACGIKLLREKVARTFKEGRRFYCSPKCRKKLFSEAGNRLWKSGRKNKRGNKGGHILIYKPDHPNARKGFIAEHRYVIENQIKRFLESNEFVHHINCNPQDNRIDNLVLVDRWQHNAAHFSIEKCIEKLIELKVLYFNRAAFKYEVIK